MKLLENRWNKNHIELEPNFLYQPKISNLESGDAFTIIPIGDDFQLLVLQFTVAEKHPVKMNGLEQIIAAFSTKNIIKKYFIFVTPLCGKRNSIQPYHSKNGEVIKRVPDIIEGFEQCYFRYTI
mmetsp:Transcript_19134/g.17354  ORF Transcript_19134/g.17354 Transcript_19134/m.17354 type:complete len:124 (+) Transcript_19134:1286-1657(+)